MNRPMWHEHAAARAASLAGCTALVLALTGTGAQAHSGPHPGPRDAARQTLDANDGWASQGTGTTGGADATAAHVHTVSDWAGFKSALTDGGSAPKILKRWNDSPLTAENNRVNGERIDLIAVHNAERPEGTLRSGAGWTPTLRTAVHPVQAVPALVKHGAGAGRIR
ncbi:hypothetical protein WJ438_31115 [Streptomyces sp. GD-15H]|uniref:hypothetical protein n=1 Tax=Streptomyces sp. GD-15H TaxID=3129112 RepID=UPI00324CFD92